MPPPPSPRHRFPSPLSRHHHLVTITSSPLAIAQDMDHYLKIENVGMTFDTKKGPFVALRDIDLNIEKGQFVTLIGHSGCGKSTLLNLITGLNVPTSGYLFLSGRQITGPGPDRGVVFQNHSLLPWLTCFENVHLAVERVLGSTEPKA